MEETAERGRARFEMEAEFVSLCADATYLRFLSAEGYTARPEFLRYCRYLLGVWARPEYARHIRHPQGLTHLGLLVTDDAFRATLGHADAAHALREAQLATWKARADLLFAKEASSLADDAAAAAGAGAGAGAGGPAAAAAAAAATGR